MALSNWDTLAVNEKGEPIAGSFTSPLGVTVLFYKNWLYVQDKNAWVEGGDFEEPTILQIHEGQLTYKDVTFHAWRGPQDGLFACVWVGHLEEELQGMLGCGVYGYTEKGEWIGVTSETIEWLTKKLSQKETQTVELSSGSVHTLEEYVLDVPEVFHTLDFRGGVRFNQGDAYFAKKFGEDIPATPPGEALEPVVHALVKGMKT